MRAENGSRPATDGSEVLIPVGEELRELVETRYQRRNDEPEVEELICLIRRTDLVTII